MPFEFSFTLAGTSRSVENGAGAPEHIDFAHAFADTIKRMGLQDVVALTAVPEIDFDEAVETTVGSKNILHLKGEHYVASPAYPMNGKHNI